jgi:hypothetical protein
MISSADRRARLIRGWARPVPPHGGETSSDRATTLRGRGSGAGQLLDTIEMEPAGEGEQVELIHGSVTDMDLMERACQDVAAVVHLAGYRRDEPWNGSSRSTLEGSTPSLKLPGAAGCRG